MEDSWRATNWRTRGYLPHNDATGNFQHIVFGLADALPAQMARRTATTPGWEYLETVETALDAGHGRRSLADARAAVVVQDALLHFNTVSYHLIAWCVMPNHVHVLVVQEAPWPMARIVHTWKSFTANAVNKALKLRGQPWAREYFDRAMRDEAHVEIARAYVENNSVAAGLAADPGQWPWSSAFDGRL